LYLSGDPFKVQVEYLGVDADVKDEFSSNPAIF
jgi:hypothetical protein